MKPKLRCNNIKLVPINIFFMILWYSIDRCKYNLAKYKCQKWHILKLGFLDILNEVMYQTAIVFSNYISIALLVILQFLG